PARLKRLESASKQIRQDLEDALGQSDATGLIVVEVDRWRELGRLQQARPRRLAREHDARLRRRAIAQPRSDVPDVAEQVERRQVMEQTRQRAKAVQQLFAARRHASQQRRIERKPDARRLHLLLGQLDLAGPYVLERAHLDLLEADHLLGD